MDDVILTPEQYEQALRIAAEVGASTALKHFEERQSQEAKELWDKRLRNTKLLLKNYRLFKSHVANAVYSEEMADEVEETPLQVLRELMMPGKSGNVFVESIRRSAARTRITVAHIDNILRCFEAYCLAAAGGEDLRRLDVVKSLYISENKKSAAELAAAYNVVERTIYKDVDAACEIIAPMMFGIDGVRPKK